MKVATIWKPTSANGGNAKTIRIATIDVDCAATVCSRYYKGINAHGANVVLENWGDDMENVRIRRLTPKECWRLQGWDFRNDDGTWNDEAFEKAKAAGISDSQLYKQAGNGCSANVVEAIGRKLAMTENETKEMQGK